MSYLIFLALLLVTAPSAVLAAEYPCPSDPGFCYRDVGDDGCFDSEVDEGPINDEIEASEGFPAIPAAGSIVCPPSVAELTASNTNIRLETVPGSSVLFYGTRVLVSNAFNVISGDEALIGGRVFTGSTNSSVEAENNVYVEDRIQIDTGAGISDLLLRSLSGDVVVGPKATIKASDVTFEALAGNVTLLERVAIQTKNSAVVTMEAGGTVEMSKPKIKANIMELDAADISILEKATFKTNFTIFDANPGDVVVERMSINAGDKGFLAPLVIFGTNVTIGVSAGGKTPRSVINYRGDQDVFIEAVDTIDIDSLVLKCRTGVSIDTLGATVHVQNSKLIGVKNSPTFQVSAGPGSTCDLTGTTVKGATLVTSCDTVVGP